MERTRLTKGRIWLNRISVALAVLTVALIAYGGLVHSAGAGLSVPDWPTTYGENMFTYPIEKWTGGIVYEHGHRLLASGIGFLMIIVTVWLWVADSRKWLKWLGTAALLAVVIQGVLGGLTVLMRLPTAVSVSHAMLAQGFLIMTVVIAMATSKTWVEGAPKKEVSASKSLRGLIFATFAFTFVQILLGAITRHTYSGLAIPDFPLAMGGLVPEFSSFNVGLHFAHRVGAAILGTLVVIQGVKVLKNKELKLLHAPSLWLLVMIGVQILLGGTVIWTREAIVPNTLHVAGGAIIFALTAMVYFRARRFYEFQSPAAGEEVQLHGVRA
ncbi:MAG: hypothetical protein CL946_00595 [Ectothiorhodospiraceae bacterium]|nr:hypothetical protein [Ectothiorhodospiraceae bacterium]